MHVAEVVALGFRYPTADSVRTLTDALLAVPPSAVTRHVQLFIGEVDRLPLGKWEELHTTTLDLSPLFVPYVGHVTWGENYRRGEFMADLNSALRSAGVSPEGELPDHIEPILRYLAVADSPLADLVEVLPAAVATMQETLAKASPRSPYRHLLAATAAYSADLRPLTIRGSR